MNQTEVIIVGGGMSGLHTAYQLEKQGIDFVLVEARDRLGGRVLSKSYASESNNSDYDKGDLSSLSNLPAFDLGPSWFWPGQTLIENLIRELGLKDSVFPQPGLGQSVYEDQTGNIQKGFYGISMEGSYRLNGGIHQIIEGLRKSIDTNKVITQTEARSVEYVEKQIGKPMIATVVDHSKNKEYQIVSDKVVIALPPRLAVSSIKLKPSLSDNRMNELNSYSTWMAGHAKFIAVYDSPFWLEQGLSGDAVSQLGPLREIHDASSSVAHNNHKNGYALFGFVGVPGSYRKSHENEICDAALDQLVRLFGKEAANPLDIVLQDWSQETFTATEIDLTTSAGHATSSMSRYTESSYDDRLIWSGTETANHRKGHNGLLEGVLEASVRSLELLTQKNS